MSEESSDRTAPRVDERKRGLYPVWGIEEAVKVAAAIKDNNAGRPMKRILLAKALELSPGSSTFRLKVSSANQYGFTSGDPYKGDTISLDDLGQSITSPKSDEERKRALIQAASKPPLFGRFYTQFNNNKIPRQDLGRNILERDFSVPTEKSEDCYKLLIGNAGYVGILQEVQGSQYIMMDSLPAGPTMTTPGVTELASGAPTAAQQQPTVALTTPPAHPTSTVESVFIAHGKNKRILDQVKQIVEFGRFMPVVTEEEESTAIPVPEKVIGAMHKCQAGIIIVSADEKVTDSDGHEQYKINENVLIEIGAATVLYRKKVILLWDSRIPVPSNLQGLYRCDFEGTSLDWDSGTKLQKTLTEFAR